MIARIAAVAAVVAAVIVVAVILLGSGGGYTVSADFQNAGQLVKGDLVEVSGVSVGKIQDLALTPNGQARVQFSVSGDYAPLRQGTIATIRQTSLSGIANRYIALELPSAGRPTIPDKGTIGQDHTVSAVDLDELFDTFGPTERDALAQFFRGSARQFAGKAQAQNAALRYLDPALVSSSRLFEEIDRDKPLFRHFIGQSANLVTDLAARHTDLSGLVTNLATTTGARGAQRVSLQQAIRRLPPFMRQADTTFVDLRSTLDRLQPLVDESKPVARKLRPFLGDLRVLAANARPTVHNLRLIVTRPGRANDLIELTRSNVPVRNAALHSVLANGKRRSGAFRASIAALRGATPELGFGRPYAPDLVGWFNDFSDTGLYDAVGGFSRAALNFDTSTIQNTANVPLGGNLQQAFSDLTKAGVVQTGVNDRCPGSGERTPRQDRPPAYPGPAHPVARFGGAPFPCNPSQFPIGR